MAWPSHLRRWLRRLGLALGLLVLLTLLAVGGLKVWIDRSPTLAGNLVARVEGVTGWHLRFSDLTASLGWFGPELAFSEVQVLGEHGNEMLHARAGRVGVDWFRMLLTWRPAARITLDGATLGVEWTDAGLRAVGQPVAKGPPVRLVPDELPTGRVRITRARLIVTDWRSNSPTAGLQTAFDDVDIRVVRDARLLEVRLGVRLPPRLGRHLEVQARLDGTLQQTSKLRWEMKVRARELEVAGWREWLPAALGSLRLPSAGRMSLVLDAEGRGASPERADWHFESLGLVVPMPEPATAEAFIAANPPAIPESCGWGPADAPAVINPVEMANAYRASLTALGIDRQPTLASYARLAVSGHLERTGATTRLELRDLDAVSGGLQWRGGRARAEWTEDTAGLQSVRVRSEEFRPAPLLPLAGLLPTASRRETLANLSPRGSLSDLDLRFRRESGWRPEGVVGLRGFGIGPTGRVPGLVGLDGELRLGPSSGSVALSSPSFHLLFPQQLGQPEGGELKAGRVAWRRDADGWRVRADDFAVTRPDGHGEAMARLWLPADGTSPVLVLRADLHAVDMRSTSRFLGVTHLPAPTVQWLRSAFLGGVVTAGSIDYAGRMRCFPFRYGGGEFAVRVRTTGARVHYAAGWPDLQDLATRFDLVNIGFTSQLLGGKVGGLSLEGGEGGIADFREARLAVKGRGSGDLGAGLRVVQASPVAPQLGPLFNGLRGRGPTKFDVELELPLRDLARRQVKVKAALSGNELAIAGVDDVATGLRGELRVVDDAIVSSGIRGQWLGGPVSFTADLVGAGGTVNRFNLAGQAQGEPVSQVLRLPRDAITGGFDWAFEGRLPLDGKPSRVARGSFVATSDLHGAAVNLPAPLAKAPAEARPLRAQLEIGELDALPATPRDGPQPAGTRLVTRLAFGNDSAAMEWIHRSQWRFTRGTVRLGAPDAPLRDASRLWIEGHAPVLDASGWIRLRLPEPTAPSLARPLRIEELLRGADVSADQLLFLGYAFPRSTAQLTGGEEGWRVDVDGPAIAGRVFVPFDLQSGRLQLDLDRLVANDARSPGGAADEVDPRELPAMRLNVRSLEFEHRQLGQLAADLLRTPEGLRLARAELKAPTFTALGSGSWTMSERNRRRAAESRLQFEVDSTDVAKTLAAWSLAPALGARRGKATLDVHWPGGPDAGFLDHLGGRITVHAEDGQVLGVEPGAGGRALGLLSLSALQRRLLLDFSDLTGKGLAFDRVGGDFELRDGDAYTQNLVLKGPAAEVGIAGRTGLRDRDYDQTVKVTGQLGGTLVAAGTLAGGPAVGAALFVFSKVFKEPLNGIARGYYRITGSWDAPEVQRIGAGEAAAPAALPPEGPMASPPPPSPSPSVPPAPPRGSP